jgi:hypothetical protein
MQFSYIRVVKNTYLIIICKIHSNKIAGKLKFQNINTIADTVISNIKREFAIIFLLILTNKVLIHIVAGMNIIISISLLSGVKSKNIKNEKNIKIENERIQDIVF